MFQAFVVIKLVKIASGLFNQPSHWRSLRLAMFKQQ